MDNEPFKEIKLKEEGENYKVSIEGSLALLALGDLGLKLWRKAIEEYQNNLITKK